MNILEKCRWCTLDCLFRWLFGRTPFGNLSFLAASQPPSFCPHVHRIVGPARLENTEPKLQLRHQPDTYVTEEHCINPEILAIVWTIKVLFILLKFRMLRYLSGPPRNALLDLSRFPFWLLFLCSLSISE